MKLICKDNVERSFISIKDALISTGFDSRLLENDENLILLGGSKNGFIKDIIKVIRGGHILNYYYHHSSKSRRINNTTVTLQEIIKPGVWIAIDPSINLIHELDYFRNASLITNLAILLTKIYRKFNHTHKTESVFKNLLIANKYTSFEFSVGYKVTFIDRPEFDPSMDYIYIDDTRETGHILNPSIIGYTTNVLISYD